MNGSSRHPARPAADTGPPANPLVNGRRAELERESLRLAADEAEATGRDPAEVLRERSKWHGAGKVNPAAMTDDRLLNTVLDQRQAKEARAAGKAEAAARDTPQARANRSLVLEVRDHGIEPNGLWDRVGAALQGKLNQHTFSTWFRPTTSLGILEDPEGKRLVVEVPNDQFRDWLVRNHREAIDEAFRQIGEPDMGLAFVTTQEVEEAARVRTA